MQAAADARGSDPELQAEQAYIDWAYECMEAMRTRAAEVMHPDATGNWVAAEIMVHERGERMRSLSDDGHALCFGRIDEAGGETWYVGRRHVEDDTSEPVVVDWRAPVAVPFYRASTFDPMDLVRRRQFVVEGRHLLDYSEERFRADDADDGAGEGADDGEGRPHVRGREALLRELDRERTGQMRDIVATIQAEQDEIIRSPLEGIVVVQGGPGTGKTAVGLHRAAFLLYGNESLERVGVLVVGPNRTFLRYIAQVLPSLDVAAVSQLTTRDLVQGLRLRAIDPPEVQRVKGDPRMAEVVARHVRSYRRRLEADVEVRLEESRRLTLPAEVVNAEADRLDGGSTPHNAAREALRDHALRWLADRWLERWGRAGEAVDVRDVHRQVRADRSFQAALDRLWPALDHQRVLRDLLGSARRMAAAAEGVLDASEQALLVRPSAPRPDDEPWTEADVPLVDEVRTLLEGRPTTFGHIVVDEAQDLSPMQLRMLARRNPTGSMTVLGDIAQGTAVWAHDSWDTVVAHLPETPEVRRTELDVGYRAPAQVIELASRLLPVAAPHVSPVQAVRRGDSNPRIVRAPAYRMAARVVEEAGRLTQFHRSVAVITPDSLLHGVRAALGASRLDVGDAVRDGLDHRVTVVPARESKGLEFDAVIVVEPAAVAAESDRGLRLLYVCLTRATRHLSIVHTDDLPAPLLEPAG